MLHLAEQDAAPLHLVRLIGEGLGVRPLRARPQHHETDKSRDPSQELLGVLAELAEHGAVDLQNAPRRAIDLDRHVH